MQVICSIKIKGKDYACYLTDEPTKFGEAHSFKLLAFDTTIDQVNFYDELISESQKKENVLFDWFPTHVLKQLVANQKLFYFCVQSEEYYDVFPISEATDQPVEINKELALRVTANHFLYKRLSSQLILDKWKYILSLVTIKPVLERKEIEDKIKKKQLAFKVYRKGTARPKNCFQLLPINEYLQRFLEDQVQLTLNADKKVGAGVLSLGLFGVGFVLSSLSMTLIPLAAARKVSPEDKELQNSSLISLSNHLNNVSRNKQILPEHCESLTPFQKMLKRTRIQVDQLTLQLLHTKSVIEVSPSQISVLFLHDYKVILKSEAIDFLSATFNTERFNMAFYRQSNYVVVEHIALGGGEYECLYAARTNSLERSLILSPPPDEALLIIQSSHTFTLVEKFAVGYVSKDNKILLEYPSELKNFHTSNEDDFYRKDEFTKNFFKNSRDKELQFKKANNAYLHEGARDEGTLTTLFFSVPDMPQVLMIKDYYFDLSTLLKIELNTPEGLYARGIFCYTLATRRFNVRYFLYAKEAFMYAHKSRVLSKEQFENNFYVKRINAFLNDYPMLYGTHKITLHPRAEQKLKTKKSIVSLPINKIKKLSPGTLITISGRYLNHFIIFLLIENVDINQSDPQLIVLDAILDGNHLITQVILDDATNNSSIISLSEYQKIFHADKIPLLALINLDGEALSLSEDPSSDLEDVPMVTPQLTADGSSKQMVKASESEEENIKKQDHKTSQQLPAQQSSTNQGNWLDNFLNIIVDMVLIVLFWTVGRKLTQMVFPDDDETPEAIKALAAKREAIKLSGIHKSPALKPSHDKAQTKIVNQRPHAELVEFLESMNSSIKGLKIKRAPLQDLLKEIKQLESQLRQVHLEQFKKGASYKANIEALQREVESAILTLTKILTFLDLGNSIKRTHEQHSDFNKNIRKFAKLLEPFEEFYISVETLEIINPTMKNVIQREYNVAQALCKRLSTLLRETLIGSRLQAFQEQQKQLSTILTELNSLSGSDHSVSVSQISLEQLDTIGKQLKTLRQFAVELMNSELFLKEVKYLKGMTENIKSLNQFHQTAGKPSRKTNKGEKNPRDTDRASPKPPTSVFFAEKAEVQSSPKLSEDIEPDAEKLSVEINPSFSAFFSAFHHEFIESSYFRILNDKLILLDNALKDDYSLLENKEFLPGIETALRELPFTKSKLMLLIKIKASLYCTERAAHALHILTEKYLPIAKTFGKPFVLPIVSKHDEAVSTEEKLDAYQLQNVLVRSSVYYLMFQNKIALENVILDFRSFIEPVIKKAREGLFETPVSIKPSKKLAELIASPVDCNQELTPLEIVTAISNIATILHSFGKLGDALNNIDEALYQNCGVLHSAMKCCIREIGQLIQDLNPADNSKPSKSIEYYDVLSNHFRNLIEHRGVVVHSFKAFKHGGDLIEAYEVMKPIKLLEIAYEMIPLINCCNELIQTTEERSSHQFSATV